MGRGDGCQFAASGPLTRGQAFPEPALDETHPVSDLWGLSSSPSESAAEQRSLKQMLAMEPFSIDGRPGAGRALLHSGMTSYSDSAGEGVFALAMGRRFIVRSDRGDQHGTVGDYLVQRPDGSAEAVSRRRFEAQFQPSADQGSAPTHRVRVGEVRQAIIEGRLEDAFLDLAQASQAAGTDVELKELSESLLEASWQAADNSGGGARERRLAERVTDWLGQTAGFSMA